MSEPDNRNEELKLLDEQMAAEPMLPIPATTTGRTPRPMETFLKPRRRPMAVAGVVENGVVRLESGVTLPERSRVIVVAAEAG
jgi:hypothetical protein